MGNHIGEKRLFATFSKDSITEDKFLAIIEIPKDENG